MKLKDLDWHKDLREYERRLKQITYEKPVQKPVKGFNGKTWHYKGKTYHELPARMLWREGKFCGTGVAEYNNKYYYAKSYQDVYWSYGTIYHWLHPLTFKEFKYLKEHGTRYNNFDENRNHIDRNKDPYFIEKFSLINKIISIVKAKPEKMESAWLDREPIGYFNNWRKDS